jgi:hypothetical protein
LPGVSIAQFPKLADFQERFHCRSPNRFWTSLLERSAGFSQAIPAPN